jgi:hypothetical protein
MRSSETAPFGRSDETVHSQLPSVLMPLKITIINAGGEEDFIEIRMSASNDIRALAVTTT